MGIGASAGGLEALQRFLSALRADLGMAYVIIQHLSPDYKSLLSEILSKHTDMPVVQVEDGIPVRPNHVYVIPPRKNMILRDGKLVLTEQKSGELNLPIDTFFESLALEAKTDAIAVILSGTGSDGTNGIKTIKEQEGFILVQSPESAKFDGMPKSAIRTGLVDALLSPEDIALELKHISESSQTGVILPIPEEQPDVDLMKRVYQILKKASNINFTHYKQATVLRRVERRMMLAHKDTLEEYVKYMAETPEEAKVLSKEVLIGVTNFFREPDFFECLREKAITNIVLHSSPNADIRVWVAGCCTGEEAYSIAILFQETMEALKIQRNVKIFATDLDAESVATAGKGAYGPNIASSVSAARLSRFFTRKNNLFVVNRDIRKMLVFSPHNIIQDPPFGKLDLISCRNLLIYFQPILQKDIFAIFHAALNDGGYLFLGKSEAVGSYTDVFPVVDAVAKIFTHRKNAKIVGSKMIPYLQSMPLEEMYGSNEETSAAVKTESASAEQAEQSIINTTLLERFMPACLVVNEKNELVYVYGDSKKYISIPVGRTTNALFDIITEQLRIPVSAALKEARVKQKMVQYKNVRFDDENSESVIGLTATPIGKKAASGDVLYALVITETLSNGVSEDAIPYDVDHMAAQRIIDLEQDLGQMQERLSRSATEQECFNEELQASNEELLTANEELQSSNEELQSVNEELYTVNSEYQIKLTELAEMNDDITNFLATTMIGIVFVDSKLSLRRFTNYVTTEFNVMEHDIGRPIDYISYHFPNINLSASCKNVLGSLVPEEREAVTNQGKTYLVRVAPFRTTENKILGCVITFVDITALKQEQTRLQRTEAQLSLARQASEAKSDFLSRMSHEIRTPMNTIVGLSELIQAQLDDKEALVDSARQLTETVRYMTSIISDIMEMSKIEHSQLTLVSEPFSLEDVLQRTIAMIQPHMTESGLAFTLSISNRLAPAYMGDATRIQQVLMNFLTNARKYTSKGGTVSFSAFEESRVNERATVVFVVSDTGIGMSKSFLPDLFKPFSRENNGDRNASSSMGLGLSIANSLIQLMDGDVAVESEEGKGSTFTIRVRLEIAPDEAIEKTRAAGETEKRDYDLAGCKILIAEDNDVNRVILETLLSRQGIRFVSVSDGEAAVQAFVDAPPYTFDCVLMDMRMPKLNGLEAATAIRNTGRADARTVPIVAVSANAFSDDVNAASQAGINDYVTKPIETNKLLELLSKYWRASKDKKAF